MGPELAIRQTALNRCRNFPARWALEISRQSGPNEPLHWVEIYTSTIDSNSA